MQKILSDSTLKRYIREDSKLSDLQKTALQRHNHEAPESFDAWFYNILDDDEREDVREFLNIKH